MHKELWTMTHEIFYNIKDLNDSLCINNNMDESNLKYYVDEPVVEDQTNFADMMAEFEQIENENEHFDQDFENMYQSDVLFAKMNNYEINFTVRQLQNVCDYYNISCKKMKKAELIAAIVDFENNPDNCLIVMKRQKMWYYVETLRQDPFMKKFIVFW
jgi:hypothetical protein